MNLNRRMPSLAAYVFAAIALVGALVLSMTGHDVPSWLVIIALGGGGTGLSLQVEQVHKVVNSAAELMQRVNDAQATTIDEQARQIDELTPPTGPA